MTTTELVLGGAIALFVARQLRDTFRAHLHAERSVTGRDLARAVAGIAAGPTSGIAGAVAGAVLSGSDVDADAGDTGGALPGSRAGWAAGTRRVVSVGIRLAFLVWLYDVTDGAAFSPFVLGPDVLGSGWHAVVTALGLTEGVARVAAVAVRAVRGRGRGPAADAAVPVP